MSAAASSSCGADGRAIGTLATKDGRAWGLALFSATGRRIDDHIILTLDLKERTATVAWSTEAEVVVGSG